MAGCFDEGVEYSYASMVPLGAKREKRALVLRFLVKDLALVSSKTGLKNVDPALENVKSMMHLSAERRGGCSFGRTSTSPQRSKCTELQ